MTTPIHEPESGLGKYIVLPHTVWLDSRWGGVALTQEEWKRLRAWQQIRYNLFGVLPKDFERDPA